MNIWRFRKIKIDSNSRGYRQLNLNSLRYINLIKVSTVVFIKGIIVLWNKIIIDVIMLCI